MIRFMSAGESHGACLVAIVEGLPAGLSISAEMINKDLARRQEGYGRGKRMVIEQDTVTILSGIKGKKTIGSPVALMIKNKDFKINELPSVSEPRPGHADLSGAFKYGFSDIRCVLERASARETAARVAGSVCNCAGRIRYRVSSRSSASGPQDERANGGYRRGRKRKDTLGRIFEIRADRCRWAGQLRAYDRRADARLAFADVDPAIKGVESDGFSRRKKIGSDVQMKIFYAKGKGSPRRTNMPEDWRAHEQRQAIIPFAMKRCSLLNSPAQ